MGFLFLSTNPCVLDWVSCQIYFILCDVLCLPSITGFTYDSPVILGYSQVTISKALAAGALLVMICRVCYTEYHQRSYLYSVFLINPIRGIHGFFSRFYVEYYVLPDLVRPRVSDRVRINSPEGYECSKFLYKVGLSRLLTYLMDLEPLWIYCVFLLIEDSVQSEFLNYISVYSRVPHT